jgi:hypothetical protein
MGGRGADGWRCTGQIYTRSTASTVDPASSTQTQEIFVALVFFFGFFLLQLRGSTAPVSHDCPAQWDAPSVPPTPCPLCPPLPPAPLRSLCTACTVPNSPAPVSCVSSRLRRGPTRANPPRFTPFHPRPARIAFSDAARPGSDHAAAWHDHPLSPTIWNAFILIV